MAERCEKSERNMRGESVINGVTAGELENFCVSYFSLMNTRIVLRLQPTIFSSSPPSITDLRVVSCLVKQLERNLRIMCDWVSGCFANHKLFSSPDLKGLNKHKHLYNTVSCHPRCHAVQYFLLRSFSV